MKLTYAIPLPSEYRFDFAGVFGVCNVINTTMGGRNLVMTDDFGNGIPLVQVPIAQWGYTTAN